MTSESTSKPIVVAGHICLDLIPEITTRKATLHELLMPGKLLAVGKAVTATGGAVANTGVALHKLGESVRLVGKVGDDPFGTAIREILERAGRGLGSQLVTDPGSGSSYTVVISPPGIDRVFLHHSGPNDTFCARDVRDAQLSGASMFHFGYPPLMRRIRENGGVELESILKRARGAGLVTSLDMSNPDPDSEAGRTNWQAFFQRVLPYVDVFLPSLDEIAFMLRNAFGEKPAEAGESLQSAMDDLASPAKDGADPMDRFVALLVSEAVRMRATEVSIRPVGDGSALSAVVPSAGVQHLPSPPDGWHRKLVARLKALAGLDLLNRRDRQEGACVVDTGDRDVHVRIVSEPAEGGEAVHILTADDAVIPSDDSVDFAQHVRQCGEWLLNAGPAIVALKLGDQGLYLKTTGDASRLEKLGVIPKDKVSQWIGRELISPCFETNVVGTTGSGDCTIAGFLAGLKHAAGPMGCLTLATATGACNVEAPDATGGIRSRDEVMRRVMSGWPKKPLTVDLPGWHWIESNKVWMGPGDLHL